MCGDGCSLALWWSFHNTYVYWIVMSIPETNESSASVKSWYKNMYQLWKQKRWGRDQDGRVEEWSLPSLNEHIKNASNVWDNSHRVPVESWQKISYTTKAARKIPT